MNEKPRWVYRFDNFSRAYILLQEICTKYEEEGLEQIAKEGMVQRFGFCTELAWKTIKDYMEYQNVEFDQILPSIVIREAYAAKLINNADEWLAALDDRNKMSHTYVFEKFDIVINKISKSYIHLYGELYETLAMATMENNK